MALTCTPWITVESPLLQCTEGVEPTLLAAALEAANDLLFLATAEQFPGLCTDVVRPCSCGCGVTLCGCRTSHALELPLGPLVVVTKVLLDGVELTVGVDWQVIDGRYLQRIGNHGWPCGQDLTKPSTADDTFEVTYTYGGTPGSAGDLALAALTCELVAAWTGGECHLPKRLTTISQEGFTSAVFDPFTFLNDGLFGVAVIDNFVARFNPDKLRRQGKYLSPEMLTEAHRITQG